MTRWVIEAKRKDRQAKWLLKLDCGHTAESRSRSGPPGSVSCDECLVEWKKAKVKAPSNLPNRIGPDLIVNRDAGQAVEP